MSLVAKAKKRAKPKKPIKAKTCSTGPQTSAAATGAAGGTTAGLTRGSAHHEHTVDGVPVICAGSWRRRRGTGQLRSPGRQ
jgi:hypothetical protein